VNLSHDHHLALETFEIEEAVLRADLLKGSAVARGSHTELAEHDVLLHDHVRFEVRNALCTPGRQARSAVAGVGPRCQRGTGRGGAGYAMADDALSAVEGAVDLMGRSGTGPFWGLASTDLNATLLAGPARHEIAEHVSAELDVLVVALAGCGSVPSRVRITNSPPATRSSSRAGLAAV
jgi:hypothetical protein